MIDYLKYWRVIRYFVKRKYGLSQAELEMLLITTIYKKLEGEEIPESKSSNPLFLANVNYTDKLYRNYIKELNKSNRPQQQQRPFQ